jgi:murein DD-endopeptidase MepM/ murein hydrolase activator NlpD
MNNSKKLVTVLAGVMAAVLLLSLLLSLFATTVGAASSSEIADQIEELEKEYEEQQKKLQEIEANLAENNKEIRNMVERKNGLDQQIMLLNEQIITINQTISAYNLMIADKQDELDAAEAKLAKLQEAYRDRIRAMEENGAVSYWSVVFQANSFSDLLDRLAMISEIAQSDRIRMDQIREVAQQVEQAREELAQQKRKLNETKAALVDTQRQMEEKSNEVDIMLYDLMAASEEYQKLLEEGEQNVNNLLDEIEQAEKAYDDAKYKEWLATSVPPTTTIKGHLTNTVNGITWFTPTKNYVITSPFGYREDPFTHAWVGHNGLDMAAPKDTPIYATRAGLVTFAGYQDNGAGNYVWINHGDGYRSIYMHMTRYIVSIGQHVEAGEIIGYVGTTGRSTGYHLHFGIKYGDNWVDPQDYIKT